MFYLFIWPFYGASGILSFQPGLKPRPPAVGAQCLNHWTTQEGPVNTFKDDYMLKCYFKVKSIIKN